MPPSTDAPANSATTSGAPATITLLIAHGSRDPDTAADHERLTRAVAAVAAQDVRPAYLEIEQPSVREAVSDAVGAGATTVRLVPLFLHVGNHVRRHLPELADAARAAHPDVEIVLDEHIGADAALVQLVASRLSR